jgi:ADP-ribose pyrophosphatase YjhB (NUDIX family)
MPHWLSDQNWKFIQRTVPVCCVDVLPLQLGGAQRREITRVGLIFKRTCDHADRWCIVGGRLLRNESLAEAVKRQLRETLGSAVSVRAEDIQEPIHVAQYFSVRRKTGVFDPRQHAIGLTFCVPIRGTPRPRGEAIAFEWFPPRSLPSPDTFGYRQDRVVKACLANLAKTYRLSTRAVRDPLY